MLKFKVKKWSSLFIQIFQMQNLNNVERVGRNYSGTRNNKVCMKTSMIKTSRDCEPKYLKVIKFARGWNALEEGSGISTLLWGCYLCGSDEKQEGKWGDDKFVAMAKRKDGSSVLFSYHIRAVRLFQMISVWIGNPEQCFNNSSYI